MEVRTYRNLLLWGDFVPVRRRDLRRLRRTIGVRLPAAYEEFLAVANGGRLPYWVDLPPGGGGEPIGFHDLYTVTPDARGEHSWGTLVGAWRRRSAALPDDLLPIARDGGGSELFLRTAPEHHGAVYAFVHGLPDWAGGDGGDGFGPVAASFDEFLDLLYICDDMAEVDWQDAQGEDPEWLAVVERWLDAGYPGWRDRPWARPPDAS